MPYKLNFKDTVKNESNANIFLYTVKNLNFFFHILVLLFVTLKITFPNALNKNADVLPQFTRI